MDDNTPNEVPNTMNLTFDEGKLFYDLYAALLSFVNRKLAMAPSIVPTLVS